MDDKATTLLNGLKVMACSDTIPREQVINILVHAHRTLERAARRTQPEPDGMERIELVQVRGPTIEFVGRQLCSDEFETRGRDALRMELELYETRAGSYIAVTISTPTERDGHSVLRATVIERQDDQQAMRFAVMEAFDWHLRARSMVVKKLKWSLKMDVD